MNEGLSVTSRSGFVVATARPRGGLFYFNTISSSNISGSFPGQSDIFLSENLQKSATELMHQRFAHVGPHILEKIDVSKLQLPNLRSKNIQGFHIDKKILNSCNVCKLCKQVEKINRGPLTKSSSVLNLVHSNT